eukprot:gene13158-9004_t
MLCTSNQPQSTKNSPSNIIRSITTHNHVLKQTINSVKSWQLHYQIITADNQLYKNHAVSQIYSIINSNISPKSKSTIKTNNNTNLQQVNKLPPSTHGRNTMYKLSKTTLKCTMQYESYLQTPLQNIINKYNLSALQSTSSPIPYYTINLSQPALGQLFSLRNQPKTTTLHNTKPTGQEYTTSHPQTATP